jgi:hypothetical protein
MRLAKPTIALWGIFGDLNARNRRLDLLAGRHSRDYAEFPPSAAEAGDNGDRENVVS